MHESRTGSLLGWLKSETKALKKLGSVDALTPINLSVTKRWRSVRIWGPSNVRDWMWSQTLWTRAVPVLLQKNIGAFWSTSMRVQEISRLRLWWGLLGQTEPLSLHGPLQGVPIWTISMMLGSGSCCWSQRAEMVHLRMQRACRGFSICTTDDSFQTTTTRYVCLSQPQPGKCWTSNLAMARQQLLHKREQMLHSNNTMNAFGLYIFV